MASQTLLDIAKLNGNDALMGLIEENLNVAPEVTRVPMRTIRGTSYRSVSRTSDPSVSFRNANTAVTSTKSTFDNKLYECKILGGAMDVDKAVARAYEDGPEAWMALEASGMMRAALQAIGRQIFYGTNTTYNGDATGFPGLLQCYDSTNMAVDAGGTSATTGSSAWFVKFGPQWTQLIAGNGGTMDLSEWREERVSNVPCYVADLVGWVGMQNAQTVGIGRIKKLTADSGKGMTDALTAKMLSQFPVGIVPDVVFMNRRSAYQLQASRTVTINANEASPSTGLISPYPNSTLGIPIIVTDSILSVEDLSL